MKEEKIETMIENILENQEEIEERFNSSSYSSDMELPNPPEFMLQDVDK